MSDPLEFLASGPRQGNLSADALQTTHCGQVYLKVDTPLQPDNIQAIEKNLLSLYWVSAEKVLEQSWFSPGHKPAHVTSHCQAHSVSLCYT